MDTLPGFKWQVSRRVAWAWLLAAAGIVGAALSQGCGEMSSTPIEPGVVGNGSITLKIEPATAAVAPGTTLEIVVKATDKNGAPVKDGTVISLENDGPGTVSPSSAPTTNGVARATFQAGAQTGNSTVKARAGGVTLTMVVVIDPNAGPPPPGGNAGDAIPISSISFADPSPAHFKVTATLSNVSVNAPTGGSGPVTVCWDWTHPPWNTYGSKAVNGNMWIIAKIDGRWHAGTWEMTATKLDNHACRTTEAKAGQPPFIQSHGPTAEWHPKSGEQIGHMISTVTRGGIPNGSQNERTPIVMTTWP